MIIITGKEVAAKIPEYPFESTVIEIVHAYKSKSGDEMVIYGFTNHLGHYIDKLCLKSDLEWYIRRNK